ncbi:MAG: methyltransferase [Eubacteriaceae bacterium]|nr:methyltransferase [Eubacteriaceae bacterium]
MASEIVDLGGGYKALQNSTYRFGVDSVLLSDYAAKHALAGASVCDLCAGCGIVGILMYAKAGPFRLTGIELDEGRAALMQENYKLNGIDENASAVTADARNLPSSMGSSFDLIATNPPYYKYGSGILPKGRSEAMARFETELTLSELLKAAKQILKPNGRLIVSYSASRFDELVGLLPEFAFGARSARFVYPKPGHNASFILLHAQKGAKAGSFVIEEPIYVMERNGEYTIEINEIYNRKGRA